MDKKYVLLAALLAGTEVAIEEGAAAETIEKGLQALHTELDTEKTARTAAEASLKTANEKIASQDTELVQLRDWKANQEAITKQAPKKDASDEAPKKPKADDERNENEAAEIERLRAEYPGLMADL